METSGSIDDRLIVIAMDAVSEIFDPTENPHDEIKRLCGLLEDAMWEQWRYQEEERFGYDPDDGEPWPVAL